MESHERRTVLVLLNALKQYRKGNQFTIGIPPRYGELMDRLEESNVVHSKRLADLEAAIDATEQMILES